MLFRPLLESACCRCGGVLVCIGIESEIASDHRTRRHLTALPMISDQGLIVPVERFDGVLGAVRRSVHPERCGVLVALRTDNAGQPRLDDLLSKQEVGTRCRLQGDQRRSGGIARSGGAASSRPIFATS